MFYIFNTKKTKLKPHRPPPICFISYFTNSVGGERKKICRELNAYLPRIARLIWASWITHFCKTKPCSGVPCGLLA